ncbi:hypothetical protein A2U01_0108591, partial [Trifolium medium]|nr:hypothetical protein [Trifolium medium]
GRSKRLVEECEAENRNGRCCYRLGSFQAGILEEVFPGGCEE